MPSKRKRAATLPSNPDPAQPSSRDASEEDAEDPVLDEVISLKQKHEEEDEQEPPAKRSSSGRTRSSRNGPGAGTVEKAPLVFENGEDEDVRMEEPPKAGLIDPVGYHTNPAPEGRTVRVYADGVFDLFHLGHMRQLEQAKKAFPNTHLTVGVTGDSETHRRKGLTVLSARERAETVRHCRWVDEVLEDCPWIVTTDFLAQHRIDYVAHDDIPYGAAEGDDIYKPIKEQGKFLVTQRTEGVSTTGIITKIVRDYEQYISRQLRRGTSRQELNISWLKKNELDLKRNVAELRNSIRTNWSNTGQELTKELRAFWQPSRPSSPAPGSGPSRTSGYFGRRSGSGSGSGEQQQQQLPNDGSRSPLPSFLSHLSPTSAAAAANGGREGSGASDFATGYSLGLVGGIRGWMTGNRRNVKSLSSRQPSSDEREGESEDMDEDIGVAGDGSAGTMLSPTGADAGSARRGKGVKRKSGVPVPVAVDEDLD